jgi:hypothetical protein
MMARLLALVLMTLTIAACAPVPITYLKPSAPNAKYTGSACAGHSVPSDRILLFGPEGVVIGINPRAYSGLNFEINLYIPPPVSVRFVSGTFLLTDEPTNVVHEYRAEYVYAGSHTKIDIREPLAGRATPKSFGYSIGYILGIDPQYFMRVSFKNVESKQLRLRIPPLMIGAQTFEFPDVDFREVTETFIVSLNC